MMVTVLFLSLLISHLILSVFSNHSIAFRICSIIFIALSMIACNLYFDVPTHKYLSKLPGSSRNKRALLLVVAHPDDECMFFTPALLELEKHYVPFALCLSNGNYDGLGSIREEEFIKATTTLGIPSSNVSVMNTESCQDGMKNKWDKDAIAYYISLMIQNTILPTQPNTELSELVILTFDSKGISSHPNHIDTHYGVKQFLQKIQNASIKNTFAKQIVGFELVTQPPPLKFTTVLSIIYDRFPTSYQEFLNAVTSTDNYIKLRNPEPKSMTDIVAVDETMLIVDPRSIAYSWFAMIDHATQLVWFRRFYIWFSKYTFISPLKRIF